MTGKLTINRDRCMGSGQCLFTAPHTFDLDDLGIAVVIDQSGDGEDAIQTAIDDCPTRSIARAAVVGESGAQ